MSRCPRILLADYSLHIVQRGINRESCFFDDEDYQCSLHRLEEAARDCRCAIHAYVLMTNHVHLLLTPTAPGAQVRLMQSSGHRHVQYANRPYRGTGSLWKGCYKSSVVKAEAYLLACMRYIELNPVRSGMVTDPSHYRWSSYRHNGLGLADERLTGHPLYQGFGDTPEARRAIYTALFRSELDDEAIDDIRLALVQSQPLGDDRFAECICAQVGVRRAKPTRGRPPGKDQLAGAMEEQTEFGF